MVSSALAPASVVSVPASAAVVSAAVCAAVSAAVVSFALPEQAVSAPAASAAASTAAPHTLFFIIFSSSFRGGPLIYPLRAFYHQPAGVPFQCRINPAPAVHVCSGGLTSFKTYRILLSLLLDIRMNISWISCTMMTSSTTVTSIISVWYRWYP